MKNSGELGIAFGNNVMFLRTPSGAQSSDPIVLAGPVSGGFIDVSNSGDLELAGQILCDVDVLAVLTIVMVGAIYLREVAEPGHFPGVGFERRVEVSIPFPVNYGPLGRAYAGVHESGVSMVREFVAGGNLEHVVEHYAKQVEAYLRAEEH